MEHKQKYFILGIIIGFGVPFLEHIIVNNSLDMTNVFVEMIVFGEKVWQYVFLYLIVISSVILYVKRFRTKINTESRLIFLISGVSLGFAIISIISTTINLI